MKKISTKKLVLTALFCALTTVATTYIRVPLPLGYINLGDAFVFLSVFLLGPFYGTAAAGIGSAVADLIGYVSYAPGTLVIKTAMAIVAYVLYKLLYKATKKAVISEIISGIAGVIVMAFGYFFYEMLFFATASVAIINVPWNLIQGTIGVALSTVLMRIFTTTKITEKIKEL